MAKRTSSLANGAATYNIKHAGRAILPVNMLVITMNQTIKIAIESIKKQIKELDIRINENKLKAKNLKKDLNRLNNRIVYYRKIQSDTGELNPHLIDRKKETTLEILDLKNQLLSVRKMLDKDEKTKHVLLSKIDLAKHIE